jgi:N,N'-diacetyllegionaminate synthase
MAEQPKENCYGLLKANPKRVYVIAEAGLNHGGNKERALALVRAAKWAGADAIKFLNSKAECLGSAARARSTYTTEQPSLPLDILRAVQKEAKRLSIEFLSSPADENSADVLNELGVHAFEIASGAVTERKLIEHVSRKGKPMLLSTGMSTGAEIEKTIDWMHSQSNHQVLLLHCAASYPAKVEELNLKVVEYLRDRFGVPVGFSDHTAGALGATVAVSLGAQIIERHFMMETRVDTPDQEMPMDVRQLKLHIAELRTIGAALGERGQFAIDMETRKKTAPRRALTPLRPITAGESIDAGMSFAKKPPAREKFSTAANTPLPLNAMR